MTINKAIFYVVRGKDANHENWPVVAVTTEERAQTLVAEFNAELLSIANCNYSYYYETVCVEPREEPQQ